MSNNTTFNWKVPYKIIRNNDDIMLFQYYSYTAIGVNFTWYSKYTIKIPYSYI